MKTYLFLWLPVLTLFLSGLPLQAQQSYEVDSLLKSLPGSPDDTTKIKKWARLGWIYGETQNNTELVSKYADSIRMLSQKLHYKRGEALSHFYYGFNERHKGNFDEAIKHLNLFINYYSAYGKSHRDSVHVANGLYQLGIIHDIRGNYEQSLSIYLRILQIYQSSTLPGAFQGVSTALNSIGTTYLNVDNYDKAIEYFARSVEILDSADPGKPSTAKAVMYANLGYAYRKKMAYEKAIQYLQQALAMNRVLENEWGIANALEELGHIFSQLEKHQKALSYYLNSLTISEKLAYKNSIAYGLSNVGYTYLMLKNYPAAHRYLLKSLALAKELQINPLIYDIYEDLSTLMAEKKNYAQAYAYYKLYVAKRDSVINDANIQQVHELQTKYETAEKDKQIALLAKEKEVQQKEARYQRTLNKAFITGLILISLLTVLSVYIFRQRLKNQRLLTAKNNEIREATFKRQLSELEMKALRAQINPHFLFNCLNSINILVLKGEIDQATTYLTKFSKLVRLILENAETTTVSLENELALLESYIQLEELRFKGKISYHIGVDQSIEKESTYLPSMVLQPFVENAIWHGLLHKDSTEKGAISITVREQGEQLLCTIEDNGVGREKAAQLREKTVLKSKSMGIKITEERLRLLNPKRLEELIRITDLKDALNNTLGTRVEINIPIL